MHRSAIEVPGAPAATARRAAGRALLAAALLAGIALRVWPAGTSLGHVAPSGDDDAAYHVLRAERMVQGAPGAPWTDPQLNHPHGATIPWPPLFDALIAAGGAVVALDAEPTRIDLERAAAWLPVILGLATILVVAALARVLAGEAAIEAAWLVALLPANATFSMIGRADQHVLEVLVSSLLFLALALGLARPARPRRGTVLLLGITLAVAAWTWMGSALYPLIAAGFAALWFVAAPPGDASVRRLASDLRDGGALGASLLAASLVAFRGFSGLLELSVLGLSGFHVLLVALVAAHGAVLSSASGRPRLVRSPLRRAAVAAGGGLLLLAAAAALPGFRSAVAHGIAGLARTDAWYANIVEFDPLFLAGFAPLTAELREALGLYGLALLAMPLAGVALFLRFRRGPPEARAPLAFLLAWGAVFLVLAVARKRFALYLVPPLAIWVGVGIRSAAGALAGRLGSAGLAGPAAALGVALLAAPAIALVPETLVLEEPRHAAVRAVARRLAAMPAAPGRAGVLGQWSLGHLVQYESGRPVVVTPFGTEGGPGAMEDAAAFFLAEDPARAEEILARRRVGLVLLDDPLTEAHFAHAFAPPGTPEVVALARSATEGARVTVAPAYHRLVVTRLWAADGAALGPLPALDGFRLLDESAPDPRGRRFKVFGAVAGARLRVDAAGGEPARVRVPVRTRDGRSFHWEVIARPGPDGVATARVPYATGENGTTVAGAAEVWIGTRVSVVSIPEVAVLSGAECEASGGGCSARTGGGAR